MRTNELRDNIYREGREALAYQEEHVELSYLKWLAICEALDEARKEALEEVGLTASNLPTHRLGGGYNKAFGLILKREKLESKYINSTTRSHAFSLMKHRVAVEKWRGELDHVKRGKLNHPSSIWREFNKTLPRETTSTRRGGTLWPNRPTSAQPKTEEEIRAQSTKPSPERMQAKQAAEAEAEAKRLGKEAEAVNAMREELQRMRIERAGFISEIEELKSASVPASNATTDLAHALAMAVEAIAQAHTFANQAAKWPDKMSKGKRTRAVKDLSSMLARLRSLRDAVKIYVAPPLPEPKPEPPKKRKVRAKREDSTSIPPPIWNDDK